MSGPTHAGGAASFASRTWSPRSLDRVLADPGRPVPAPARAHMERAFGHDFGSIRIHDDAEAAASASALRASAFSIGDHVVFGAGRYRPDSDDGRRLLAHELAHTVQAPAPGSDRSIGTAGSAAERAADQAAASVGARAGRAGAAARSARAGAILQCQDEELESEADRKRRQFEDEVDEFTASALRAFSGGIETSPPELLIPVAVQQAGAYEDAEKLGHRHSRLAYATNLARIHRQLESLEQTAERAADGALLTPSWGEMIPWTAERPAALSDIKPFNDLKKIAAWTVDDQLWQERDRAERAARQAARKQKPSVVPRTPPPLVPDAEAAAKPAAAAKGPTLPGTVEYLQQGAEVAEQEETRVEKAASSVFLGEVSRGLAALSGKSLKDVMPSKKEGDAAKPTSADTNLLKASAQVWFVSNRLYVLDRTGHLFARGESWFDLSSIRGFKPGGTYFLIPVDKKEAGLQLSFVAHAVAGHGAVGQVRAEINFPRVLTAMIPVDDLRKHAMSRSGGIGLVIARDFGKHTQTTSDIDFGKLGEAVQRAPAHIEWAVLAEIAHIREDLAEEVVQQIVGLGIGYLGRLLPPVQAAMFMYQALELAQWLGEVGNVAVHAKTDDEIDLVAQAIARKVAGFLVSEVISRGLHAAANRIGAKIKVKSPEHQKGLDEAFGQGKKTGDAEENKPKQTEKDAPKEPPKEAKKAEPADAEPKKPAPPPEPKKPAGQEKKTSPKDAPEVHGQQRKPKAGEPDVPPVVPKPKPPAPPAAAQAEPPAATPAPAKPKPATADAPKAAEAKAPQAAAPDAAKPATKPKYHAIDDVLTPDRKGFDVNSPAVQNRLTPEQLESLLRLDSHYTQYKDSRAAGGREHLGPEAWLKHQTTGRPRENAEPIFGPDYRRTGAGSGTPRPKVRVADIPKPAGYDDARLNADFAAVKDHPGLWERLGALRKSGVPDGTVHPSLLNILKGNIGEILAHPIVQNRLAKVRETHPDARLEAAVPGKGAVKVQRIRPDGTYEPAVLFSDGLIVSEKGGRLTIHDAVEIKAGGRGGQEATSQFFEWREGRFNDGDRIVLPDGRKFTYHPGKKGPGYVDGVQTSTPHVIAPRGSEQSGLGSGEQVGAATQRHGMGVTASELDYLARKALESLVTPAGEAGPQSVAPASPAAEK